MAGTVTEAGTYMITMENSACTDTKTDNIPDGTSDEECRDPDPRIQVRILFHLFN